MSYCRWSSDDFQSDVYCYENVSGYWTTHVAGNKVVFAVPLPDPIDFTAENVHAWSERHKIIMELVHKSPHVPIGLPHDGETFNDDGPQGMIDRLLYLRGLGYRVPEYALDTLREEIEQRKEFTE